MAHPVVSIHPHKKYHSQLFRMQNEREGSEPKQTVSPIFTIIPTVYSSAGKSFSEDCAIHALPSAELCGVSSEGLALHPDLLVHAAGVHVDETVRLHANSRAGGSDSAKRNPVGPLGNTLHVVLALAPDSLVSATTVRLDQPISVDN
mmetsp:Transcript_16142/g.22755  ORF Transcript_16142/g.22755 Transcript_16142/m.22755 type:complete len:147 (-) Transcript_16142:629-1069(-)